ncbi:MAG TPA: DUF433 domain-containing protein [Devosia sp.]|jgi:uncharacterized protein (DUF433 family)|uniref:DUF433 domain-containing protein n=1 Tax=Devosia sp. TaxID=1871048 RepID=UPI002F94FC11
MTDEDLLLLKRIVATPGVLGGKPRIDGTRVGVSHVLEALAAGDSPDAIVDSLPWVTHEDIKAALLYAAHSAENSAVQAAE